jgi:hypothetical protein
MEKYGKDFESLSKELEGLMHALQGFLSAHHESEHKKDLETRFKHIGQLAKKIGGSIWDDYEELEPLFWGFIRTPFKKENFHKIVEVIEKFRNELREL